MRSIYLSNSLISASKFGCCYKIQQKNPRTNGCLSIESGLQQYIGLPSLHFQRTTHTLIPDGYINSERHSIRPGPHCVMIEHTTAFYWVKFYSEQKAGMAYI